MNGSTGDVSIASEQEEIADRLPALAENHWRYETPSVKRGRKELVCSVQVQNQNLPGSMDDDYERPARPVHLGEANGWPQAKQVRSSQREAPLADPSTNGFGDHLALGRKSMANFVSTVANAWKETPDNPPLLRSGSDATILTMSGRNTNGSTMSLNEIADITKEEKDEAKKNMEAFEGKMYVEKGKVGVRGLQMKNAIGGVGGSQQTYAKAFVHRMLCWWAFDAAMGIIIVANSITIGIETSHSVKGKKIPLVVTILEKVFLVMYTFELCLRFFAYGRVALKGGWVKFDTCIVFCGWVEVLMDIIFADLSAEEIKKVMIIRMLRLARLARVVRLMVQFRTLWLLVHGLVHSLGTLCWTCLTMVIVMYLFAVLGMELIQASDDMDEGFNRAAREWDGLGTAMLTLLQVLTLDSVGPLYKKLIIARPYLVIYFGIYIGISSVALMNLVTAIMVESSMAQAQQDKEGRKAWELAKKKALMPKIQSMFKHLDDNQDGEVTVEEIRNAPQYVKDQLEQISNMEDIEELFNMMDIDKSGCLDIDEFCEGLLRAQSDKPMELLRIMQQCQDILFTAKDDRNGHYKTMQNLEQLQRSFASLEKRMSHMETNIGIIANALCPEAVQHKIHRSASMDVRLPPARTPSESHAQPPFGAPSPLCPAGTVASVEHVPSVGLSSPYGPIV